jgi:WD40 repeat protein
MVANVDGSGERQLAVSKPPTSFEMTGPAWSADGKRVAAVTREREAEREYIVTLDAATGDQVRVGDRWWTTIEGLAWLPDGSGLVLGGLQGGHAPSGPGESSTSTTENQTPQVWIVDFPSGEAHRVTNDLNDYGSVSVSADGRSLVTVQGTGYANLWIVPMGASEGKGRRVTTSRTELVETVHWTDTGIVCSIRREGLSEIWFFGPDGSGGRRLDVGLATAELVQITAGKRILFTASRQDGRNHVWKTDTEGSQPVQLTNGSGEELVGVDPDGRWFYYSAVGSDESIWRQGLDPGEPPRQVLADVDVVGTIPPRRDRFSYAYYETRGDRLKLRGGIAPIDDQGMIGASATTYDVPSGVTWGAWGPTDPDITWLINREGVSNLWVQSISGDMIKPLTHYETGFMSSFDFSPDFKQLAIARGERLRDVVMLTDFR